MVVVGLQSGQTPLRPTRASPFQEKPSLPTPTPYCTRRAVLLHQGELAVVDVDHDGAGLLGPV